MYLPVGGGRITSNYQGGFRSSGGHSGVDFGAPSGTPIRAAVGGKVLSATKAGAYGNLVKVQHDDGSVGYYAHMSGFNVRPNMRIERGSVLGYVGSTGNSTGPHLHFEIRRDGKPVDPMAWLGDDVPGGKQGGSLSESTSTQYRDPQEVLSGLAQPVSPATGNLAAGFATPALDNAERTRGQVPAIAPAIAETVGSLGVDNAAPEPIDVSVPDAPEFPTQPSTLTGGDFDRFFSAIRGKESGGNYSARNSSSGALGAYQIMPSNIASWSKAALGYSVTQSQFLNSPKIQDQIARHRLNSYYQKYGARGAAIAWYAGEGAVKYSSSSLNRKQGNYPSINDYAMDILRRAGL